MLNEVLSEPVAKAVELPVARIDLWSRRWRGEAADGTPVAVSLEKAARNGDCLRGGERVFRICQRPEDVLVIPMPAESSLAAKIGWYLGNRHLPIEVREEEILLELFPTLTDSLDRIGIAYQIRHEVLNCRPHSEHTH
ncbi:hypothetical protein JIN78_07240 [Roseibacillus ishigakijimensis]|uniref:Urease accessory protein UreE C-terminal domain-containing protein n=1 Tax=Roseibacillus ishigakijimensis TaxID=454146 RepID=A0A934RQZ6_9BACT|nr:hypothetical protein [Roseibacillus ishigakijimensis]